MSQYSKVSTLRLASSVLETRDKMRLLVALCLVVVGTALEMGSLGMVIPVVEAVVGGDSQIGRAHV